MARVTEGLINSISCYFVIQNEKKNYYLHSKYSQDLKAQLIDHVYGHRILKMYGKTAKDEDDFEKDISFDVIVIEIE